jgi:hypothetical protein
MGMHCSHASDRLKDDAEIVRAAVQQDGRALEYASDRLRMDITLVCLAITSGPPLLERHRDPAECCRIYLGGIRDRVLSALEVVVYGSLHLGQVSFLEEEGTCCGTEVWRIVLFSQGEWMWVLRQVVVSMPGIGNPLPPEVNMLIDGFSGMETERD